MDIIICHHDDEENLTQSIFPSIGLFGLFLFHTGRASLHAATAISAKLAIDLHASCTHLIIARKLIILAGRKLNIMECPPVALTWAVNIVLIRKLRNALMTSRISSRSVPDRNTLAQQIYYYL